MQATTATTSMAAPVAKPVRRQSSALWGLPAEILLTSKIGQAITPSDDGNGTVIVRDCAHSLIVL